MLADEMPFYAGPDERMVELQGETLKVLKALEAVVGHLRKFLVDHSVLPLFEKSVSFFLLAYVQPPLLPYFRTANELLQLFFNSSIHLPHKIAKRMPGLTSPHFFLHLKV